MNKSKTLFAAIAMLFLMAPAFSFGQDAKNEDTPKETPISYAFITEYGPFMGGTAGFTGIFVNGIRIKTQNVVGIGVGYEYDTDDIQSIPLFANFRHYFPSKRTLKPLVNVAIGTRFSFGDRYYGNYYGSYRVQMREFGLYSTIAAGFKVKVFSFTSGFFFKSYGTDKFFGGVEIKAGITL